MSNYKNGDIVRWRWTQAYQDKHRNKINAGTLYWCMSRIAIFDAELNKFKDTYWSNDNKGFSETDIGNDVEVTYVANLSELIACHKSDYDYYDKQYCVNLSHANSRGQFYLKKGAPKSLDKMRSVLEAHISYQADKLQSTRYEFQRLVDLSKNLTLDTHLPHNDEVFVDE